MSRLLLIVGLACASCSVKVPEVDESDFRCEGVGCPDAMRLVDGGGGAAFSYSSLPSCQGLWLVSDSSGDADDLCTRADQGGANDASPSIIAPLFQNAELPPNVATGATRYGSEHSADASSFSTENNDIFRSANFSAGCWIRASDLGDESLVREFLGSMNRGASLGWLLGFREDLREVRVLVGATTLFASAILDVDSWHHVAFSANQGGDMILFVDGVFTDMRNDANPAELASTRGLHIGDSGNSAPRSMHGSIYECWYHNETLSSTDICRICRCGHDGAVADRGALCGDCLLEGGSCDAAPPSRSAN